MSATIDDIMQQGLSDEARAKALNDLGKKSLEQNDIEHAIACWEKSIACYGKPGFAQAQLMKAYNIRRRECAQAGDSGGAERYSQKIDALMQQSKDAIRYGF
ncbi:MULTISPECIES: hypothetical protein [unclassified Brenneria]|uniref:hypothetical protein n=1 Tax=unclassified Brenneria TaxID=2634434 RepID=UPI001551DE60|nr:MULTISPECIES: hypothetical protein [unclassified Brenneria]MBJ7220366.1 hypothetical protein [Brenneria sp. L3-3C-1]MEE3641611.1 hypothetical protein [Brenneria sp. L3_3C_1]MEE3649758.1 hypothetical protein [Brenneria sp. HEZEL_4_2_4]NPC99717.1 hypothetical protein [Brenneria sp. hezel4-2-4]